MSDPDPSSENPEVDLKIGDKVRVGLHDCKVKEVHETEAIVENDKMGKFPVPRRQPASHVNAPAAKREANSVRGPENETC